MTYQLKRALSLTELVETSNVCDLLDDDDLASIGNHCLEGYQADVQSRADWVKRKANANKLALQVKEEKTFPWPHASSIKFPLVTVAALQFEARAYPALISGSELVKTRVYGDDPTGEKKARGERIAAHMTWQCLEQDRGWEEEHDKALLAEAIAGCVFIKQAFEPGIGRIKTQLVLPNNLVVDYFTRSLADSQRYTHTFNLSRNDIHEREADGRFRKVPVRDEDAGGRLQPIQPEVTAGENELTQARDRRQGILNPQQDSITPFFTGEMYCWFDFDKDGYEEPYVVVFDIGSGVIRRIYPRFIPSGVRFTDGKKLWEYSRTNADGSVDYELPKDAKVYTITPVRVFTKYGFIPSPDGGFYDLGLGDLLGPINEGVNSALDQLFDAATMKNLGGGFLGRAFKGRSGPITFAPQMWHPLDGSGDDIRKSVMPLPVPEPSAVLFQLVGFLVQYAERIVSATDIQMGAGDGQNVKTGTAEILNQNGQRVYVAIYKRNWRSLREEFDVRYELNANFFEVDEDFTELTTGANALVRPDDYRTDSLTVRPAADPYIVSDAEAQKQATMLIQWSAQTPGANRYRANRRWLKAMQIPNADELYPPPRDPQTGKELPDYPPPPNPKLIEAQMKQQKLQGEQMEKKMRLLMDAEELTVRIDEMRANTLKLMAEAKATMVDPLIKLLYAHIEADSKRRDRMLEQVKVINDTLETMNGIFAGSGSSDQPHAGMAAMAGPSANAGLLAAPRSNGASAHG